MVDKRPLDVYWSTRDDLHDDYVLRLGSEHFVCDSYWLVVGYRLSDGSTTGNRRALGQVFGKALNQFQQKRGPSVLFIPFGFSDQCTHWLRAERFGEDVELTVGWSADEFHTHDMTRNPVRTSLEGWSSDSPSILTPTEVFEESLRTLGEVAP